MQNKFLLGAHMSIAGGLENALFKGASIGCSAIQIFTSSNRSWRTKEFTQEEITKFLKAKEETGISDVITHSNYLINLATEKNDVLEKSIISIENELIRCNNLKIKYLVMHPGAGVKNEEKALEQVISSLIKILDNSKSQTYILLENTAGQGTSIGYSFEQLAFLLEPLKSYNKIGICFDTCHAWAAGYDFSNKLNYEQMWDKFDKLIGLKYLHAIHINDSAKPKGSYVDRHQNIGQGTIPMQAFKLLMNDTRFKSIPKILETPEITEELIDFSNNMNILLGLID